MILFVLGLIFISVAFVSAGISFIPPLKELFTRFVQDNTASIMGGDTIGIWLRIEAAYMGILGVILLAFGIRRKRKKASIYGTAKTSLSGKSNGERLKKNTIQCLVNGSWNVEGSSGYYTNGIVYCIAPNGNDYQVGSYEYCADGSVLVRDNDGFLRGRITAAGKIVLSRQGTIDRLLSTSEGIAPLYGGIEKYNEHLRGKARPIEWECAELFDNGICTFPNTDCVALCDGSKESAAAFICLHLDGYAFSNDNSPFHSFFYGWL